MPTEVLAGLQTYWRVSGKGARPAHFIHCSLAHNGAFAPVMHLLGDEFSMVAVDMPGHGRSGPPDASRDYQVQVAQVSGLLIAREGRPVDLIGHSFGATVALRIAREHPELVRRLVLIEPVFFAVLDDADHPEFAREAKADQEFGRLIEAGDRRGAARFFLSRWGLPGEWDMLPEERKTYLTARIHLVLLGRASIIDRNASRLTLDDMAGITTPTVLINGDKSPAVMGHIVRQLAQTMPNATAHTIAGAGHMVPLSHPAEVARLISGD
jgi:lipase